jgi:hypothetical protein
MHLDEGLLRVSRQRNDSGGLVLGHQACGSDQMLLGRFASSRPHYGEALALYNPISHRSLAYQTGSDPQAVAQAYLGFVLFCLGLPDEALAQTSAAIVEARRLAHPPTLASSLMIGAMLLSLVGDNRALDERADKLVAVAIEQGVPGGTRWERSIAGGSRSRMAMWLRGYLSCEAVRRVIAPPGLPYYTAFGARSCES